MTIVFDKRPDASDVGGPVVAVCAGGRCAALCRLRSGEPHWVDALDTAHVTPLRRAVAATPGALLVRLQCVGACVEGLIIGVGLRAAGAANASHTVWVTGADRSGVREALLAWLADDWSDSTPPPPAELLPALVRITRSGGPR